MEDVNDSSNANNEGNVKKNIVEVNDAKQRLLDEQREKHLLISKAADGYPFLVLSESSIEWLGRHICPQTANNVSKETSVLCS